MGPTSFFFDDRLRALDLVGFSRSVTLEALAQAYDFEAKADPVPDETDT